jgi:glyoxylase-like metal-dependent hydrolase (beta-lactamase superfamily II)
MTTPYIKQLLVGPMANFVYLIGDREAGECFVVDPAWDIPAIVSAAEAEGMTIKGALVTHYHPDHCGGHLWGHDIQGVAELVGALNVPVYANKHEVEGLMKITGLSKGDIKACDSGDKLTCGHQEITLIHTPGHTPGSQCFLCQNSLVSGDTLFITGCGRTDLPGGDSDKLYESLTTKLAKLPKDTVLYPGHNYDAAASAPMHEVLEKNPYLQVASLSEWKRMFG